MYKILLIEDNEADRELFSWALRQIKTSREVSLEIAVNVKEGLDKCKKNIPDLIILDWSLPDKDGDEFLKLIKSEEDVRLIPIIVFSTSSAQKDTCTAYELGATSYFEKPFSSKEQLQFISDLIAHWLNINFQKCW